MIIKSYECKNYLWVIIVLLSVGLLICFRPKKINFKTTTLAFSIFNEVDEIVVEVQIQGNNISGVSEIMENFFNLFLNYPKLVDKPHLKGKIVASPPG